MLLIVKVKVHEGKRIENAIRSSGMSITIVAQRLGVTRRTLYNYFELSSLDPRLVNRIENIIHLRISQDSVSTDHLPHSTQTNQIDSVEYWKGKYLELLEKYTQLLEKKNFIS